MQSPSFSMMRAKMREETNINSIVFNIYRLRSKNTMLCTSDEQVKHYIIKTTLYFNVQERFEDIKEVTRSRNLKDNRIQTPKENKRQTIVDINTY